jgi:hypothetical protein
MTKKYSVIAIALVFSFFSAIESTYAQTKSTRKVQKRAAKASRKAPKKEEASVLQQVEVVPQPQTTSTIPSTPVPSLATTPIKTIQYSDIVANSQDLVITKPNGNVNWTQQYIEATGQSVIDNERFKNSAQAKLMATRGAVVIAQRNLLEIVKGVQIVGETTVQDMITTSDYVYSRVEGVVKGAQQIGEAKEKNGFIEVRLRMPIYGKESLAGTLDDQLLARARKENGFEKSPLLDQESSDGSEGIDGSNPIVFNVENQGQIDPSMYPIVVDDNGKVLFDFSQHFRLKEGKFPQYLQMGKDILQALGNTKGVDIINMIQTGKGQFQIPQKSSKKVFWNKVGRIAQDVGAALFKLVF